MAGTDFYDEDLQSRDAARRRLADSAAEGLPADGEQESGVQRRSSGLNLTRMARHRDEVEEQVAVSTQELDRLRMRQEELERERLDLEDLRDKQALHETGKKEITERLHQSLVMLEKEYLRADRRVDLLQASRTEFQSMLAELELIDEEAWSDEEVRDELAKSIVLIEECRITFDRTMARISDELGPDRHFPKIGGKENHAFPSLGYWFKVAWIISFPLVLALVVLAISWYFGVVRGMQ